jgi:hypothetical protein
MMASVAALVLPGVSSGQGWPYDSVAGAVKLLIPNYPAPGESTTETMVFAATNGPSGTKGVILFRSPVADTPAALVDVTCLRVSGNEAWVGGTVRNPFLYVSQRGQPPSKILYFAIQMQDNAGAPDAVHPVVFDDRPRSPTFTPCNIQQPLFAVSGNLVVHDG